MRTPAVVIAAAVCMGLLVSVGTGPASATSQSKPGMGSTVKPGQRPTIQVAPPCLGVNGTGALFQG